MWRHWDSTFIMLVDDSLHQPRRVARLELAHAAHSVLVVGGELGLQRRDQRGAAAALRLEQTRDAQRRAAVGRDQILGCLRVLHAHPGRVDCVLE